MALEQIYLKFIQNNYIQSIVILVSFFLVSKLIVFISEKYVRRITKKTKTKVDDFILDVSSKPISLILLLFGIRLAVLPLFLPERINYLLLQAITSFIILISTYLVIKIFRILIDNWGKKWAEKTKSTIDDQLIGLLQKFSKVIFSILGIIIILDTWGVKVGPLLASLGIAGIAVAFALQTTLGNIFGGISLIIDKSIKVGDVIKLDADTIGTVLDIGLRSTKIRTFDNEVFIIPNGTLANSKIQNYVLPEPKARLVLPFSVAYGTDVTKVKQLVLDEVNKINGVLKDPESVVRFTEMADSGLNFKAYIWCDSYSNRFEIRDIANTRIYNALNKAKISIPFPQMDVHIKKE